VKAAVCLQNK